MKPNLKLSEDELARIKFHQSEITIRQGLLSEFVNGLLMARGLRPSECNINMQTGMIENVAGKEKPILS